jgi:hypothetical protein
MLWKHIPFGYGVVLVRRDSEFGLLRDLEKRIQILGSSLVGCWGPAPRPPGFIALGHQQVLPNVLAGFERTEAGVAAEGSHCAGWSPAQLGSENLSTASLRRSGCFPAEPCPPERHWRIRQGQALVARLFEALKIFPAVGGQLVFAELRHEYERPGDVNVSNIDVPVLMRGEWLNETFTFTRLLATWTQHIGLTQNAVDCSGTAGDDLITGVVGAPASTQGAPLAFFSCTFSCSSPSTK